MLVLLPLDIEAPTKDGVAASVEVVVGSTDDELDEEELEEVVVVVVVVSSDDVVVAAGVVSHDEAAVSVAVSLLVAAVALVVVVVAVKLAAPPLIERMDVRREPTKVDSAREMIGIEWSHSSSLGSSRGTKASGMRYSTMAPRAGTGFSARSSSRNNSPLSHTCSERLYVKA